MTEAVLAMDGFSYQKSSLEAHRAAKGQPLISPLTGDPMGDMYMSNHTLKCFGEGLHRAAGEGVEGHSGAAPGAEERQMRE